MLERSAWTSSATVLKSEMRLQLRRPPRRRRHRPSWFSRRSIYNLRFDRINKMMTRMIIIRSSLFTSQLPCARCGSLLGNPSALFQAAARKSSLMSSIVAIWRARPAMHTCPEIAILTKHIQDFPRNLPSDSYPKLSRTERRLEKISKKLLLVFQQTLDSGLHRRVATLHREESGIREFGT